MALDHHASGVPIRPDETCNCGLYIHSSRRNADAVHLADCPWRAQAPLRPAIGMRLRFFSERVFGVWVDGVITRIGPEWLTLAAYFHGNKWKEKKSVHEEFYYPCDHPQRGEAFKFDVSTTSGHDASREERDKSHPSVEPRRPRTD
jgi:hypothetical protein